jgi:hypothetical protein
MHRYVRNPLFWMAIGGIAFALFGLLAGTSLAGVVACGLIGIVVAIAAVASYLSPRSLTTSTSTKAPPSIVRAHVRRGFGTAPWIMGLDEPNEQVYWRNLHPDIALVILLALLGIIPAIVYVVASSKSTQTISILTKPLAGGTAMTVTGRPRSHSGRKVANRLINDLIRLGESPGIA